MQLYIDPRGGMAGDMFAAALISAGADEKLMLVAMLLAANKIGKASVKTSLTHDGAHRLHIEIEHGYWNCRLEVEIRNGDRTLRLQMSD